MVVELKKVPDIELMAINQFGSKKLHDIVGNEDTEIVIWRLRCPHCKILLDLVNQEKDVKRIAINIDDKVNKQIRKKVEDWETITHFHVNRENKEKLLTFFGITHVPFTEKIEVDLFDNVF